jgi:hypothetical protein
MAPKKTTKPTTLGPEHSQELVTLFEQIIVSIIQISKDNDLITGNDAIDLSKEQPKIRENIKKHAENALKYVTDPKESHLKDIIKIQLGNLDDQTNTTIHIPIRKRDLVLNFLQELSKSPLEPQQLQEKLQEKLQENATPIFYSPPQLPLRTTSTKETMSTEIIYLLKKSIELTKINSASIEAKKEQIKNNYIELSNDITHIIKFWFNRIKHNN